MAEDGGNRLTVGKRVVESRIRAKTNFGSDQLQLVAGQVQRAPGEGQYIHVTPPREKAGEGMVQKTQIKGHVIADQQCVAQKGEECRPNLIRTGSEGHHLIRNAIDRCDPGRNETAWVEEGVKKTDGRALLVVPDGRDLNDLIGIWAQAGRFGFQDHIIRGIGAGQHGGSPVGNSGMDARNLGCW